MTNTMSLGEFHATVARAMSEADLLANVKRAAAPLGYIVLHNSDSRKAVKVRKGPDVGKTILIGDADDKGRLDTELIPDPDKMPGAHTLYRELKGYDGRHRLGKLTPEQEVVMYRKSRLGEDVGLWAPEDYLSGRILRELRQ